MSAKPPARPKAKRAFTLVEVLVAIFILGVGVVGLMGALSGLTRAERAVAEKNLVDQLAHEKLDELVATQTWQTESGGSFEDPRFQDYTYTVEATPVDTEGLTVVTVQVNSLSKGSATARTIVFVPLPESGGAQRGPANQPGGGT